MQATATRPTRWCWKRAYRVQFTKFFWVQPDIQWVNRPYGTGRIPNALVIGAETGITF